MAVVDEPSGSGEGPVGTDASGGQELDHGALHFFDSIVMAVAGTAPAYSISVSIPVLVGSVGLAGPAALLWCGLPMLGVAIAYWQLNKMGASAGAAYEWVGRIMHPYLGFIAGWCLVVSAIVFMVEGSLPAGQATISLFSQSAAGEAGWYTLAGVAWFLVMSYFVARGARITANAQWIMSSIELLLLVVFGVWAYFHHPHIENFSLSWLTFSHFGSAGTFATGALTAAFFYWGWDVSSNLSEETTNSESASGASGIISVIVCFLLFELFTIALNMNVSHAKLAGSTESLQILGRLLGNNVGAKLMIIALMLSTIATLETTLIQVTRSLFAMARADTLPAPLARIKPEWNTPVFATVVVVAIAMVLFVISNFAGGIYQILADGEYAIDLQITMYYALAGFAAVIGFHRYAFKSPKNVFLMFLFPLLGAGFMLYIFIEALVTGFGGYSDSTVAMLLGLGGIVIAIVPIWWYHRKGSTYLHQKPTWGRVEIAHEFDGQEKL